ncbi:uncharacterized protein J7T55_001942 [Diaporthe amygdali]|uniref:uncharacterized protein n=1 Tax=Phomopsis amygdali TaxID=1214568 RepID=UPI0022FDEA3C|nr:uncharacterized protein J7T55_001942 [Diaporthe amygdali]KAJ0117742.1 uncharacterized protein J7T55_001942 [Diaporthe amygdali]
MSSGFVEESELERGIKTSQVPPVVAEAVIPEHGQTSIGRESEDKSATISTSAVDEDDIDAVHDTGQIGLARLKSFDSRFDFYPAFSTGRSLVLDSLAGQIFRIMKKMDAYRKKIKAEHHVEPCDLGWGERRHKRWEKLTVKLWKKIKEYDAASINAKTVNEYERPGKDAIEKLKFWLDKKLNAQRHMYNDQDVDDFRMLGPKRGPIKKLVHETLPTSRLARFLLRPFRARSSKAEHFESVEYGEKTLNWIGTVAFLLCACVLFVIPLALTVYFEENITVKVSLILVMCLLVTILALATEQDEGRRLLLLFAYVAIVCTLLS